jgi:hypothetical protein
LRSTIPVELTRLTRLVSLHIGTWVAVRFVVVVVVGMPLLQVLFLSFLLFDSSLDRKL